MSPDTDPCLATRNWLSAQRDGEAGNDPNGQAHLDSCVACTDWSATSDHLTRQVRLRAPLAPASVRASVASITLPEPAAREGHLARALLAFAAISGTVMLVLGAVGLFGHSHLGSADGRQAEALLIALIGGFALAAWRPARLAAGLMPVAVLAAAITVALSIIEVTSGDLAFVDELSHLPLVIGAIGATIAARASQPVAARAPVDSPVHAAHGA